ncbi:MAG: hypothetical protein MR757_06475 [Proteobacteria bacterium]|nr:hypothetical protein [Pseudomonadota bacterium]
MKNHLEIILLIAAVAAGIIFAPIIAPIYWDEIPQYVIGQYSFNQYASLLDSVFGTSLADPAYADFENFQDRDYGPVFEVLLIAMGKAAALLIPGFGWDDLIIMRHIAVYLVFVLGTCGVYSMASRRLQSRFGGILAAALFFLSPRIFGNAFYNSKDIVFLSFFVLSVNYVLLAAGTLRMKNVIYAALFTALAVSVRFIGIFTLFLGVFVWCVSWHRAGLSRGKIASAAGGFAVLTLLLVYAFYPFLWPSPVSRMHDVVFAMSKFTRHTDIGLFNGQFIKSSEMPFFVPRWMAITLPFLFMAACLWGQLQAFALILRRTFSLSLWKDGNELSDYVVAGLGLAPVIASVIAHPWLYDGWRHFYFVMPFLSVSAAAGIFCIASFAGKKANIAAASLGALAVIESIAGIIWFFPYPNCYFNAAAGSDLIRKYDLDYAGTSGYEALVQILSSQKKLDRPVNVAADSINLMVIMPRLGSAMKLIGINEKVMPDYVLSGTPELSEVEKKLYREVSAVRTICGETLIRILAPNEYRDGFCKTHAEQCQIDWH